ncbi:MAG: hypothetical protein AB7H88_01085 [Vicinamibacterales bacterium]
MSEYAPQLTGLDYPVMAAAFSGFSDLGIRLFAQDAGLRVRVSNQVILNGTVRYNRYTDQTPYLLDTTGRFVTVSAGLSWMF